MKTAKIKKFMGIGSLIISVFFLFNPDIAIIDIIPDVFGYVFILFGLSQLSDVNDKIEEARNCFKKAAICNLIKLSLIVVLFGMVSQREMPVSMLLFTFVMNIFDLIYVIPGYLYLFSGLMYLGERLDSEYVLGRRRFVPRKTPVNADEKQLEVFHKKEMKRKMRLERALSNTEKFQRATIMFVLFKAVTPVLPELTSLLEHGYNDSRINYYDFIYLFRIVAVFLMFLAGIIWLVLAIKYYVGVMRDRVFIEAVKEKYAAEVLPNKVHFAKKFASMEIILFVCGAFFLTNLYFDEVNIVPSAIAGIILAIASYRIRKYSSKWILTFISSIFMTVSSVILEVSRFDFNAEYIKEQIMRNPQAYAAWEQMTSNSVLFGITSLLTVVSLMILAWDIAKKYTGYFMPGTDSFDPERATKELHSELTRPLIVTGIFGLLQSACVPLYFISMWYRFEAIWFFDLVFSMIFAFCFMQNLHEISKNIRYKHFLGDE